MTSPGVVSWVINCGGQLLTGDGTVCLQRGGAFNVVTLLVLVAVLFFIIKKKKKQRMDKSFGCFINN